MGLAVDVQLKVAGIRVNARVKKELSVKARAKANVETNGEHARARK